MRNVSTENKGQQTTSAYCGNTELDKLLEAIAHEIRNPLTGISTNVQYLQMVFPYTVSQKEIYSEIMEAVDRLERITQRISECARPLQLKFEKASFNSLLADAIAEQKELLRNRKVELTLNLNPDLPEIAVDVIQFHRALVNLLEYYILSVDSGSMIGISSRHDREEIIWEVSSAIQDQEVAGPQQIPLPLTGQKNPELELKMLLVRKILAEHHCRLEWATCRAEGPHLQVIVPVHTQRII